MHCVFDTGNRERATKRVAPTEVRRRQPCRGRSCACPVCMLKSYREGTYNNCGGDACRMTSGRKLSVRANLPTMHLIYGAPIYTFWDKQPLAEAMAVHERGASWRWGAKDDLAARYPDAKRIAVDGKAVVPAFNRLPYAHPAAGDGLGQGRTCAAAPVSPKSKRGSAHGWTPTPTRRGSWDALTTRICCPTAST
jgi:hypothetical protein